MIVDKVLEFLKGNITIEAEGDFLERFLNICMRRGIYLTNVKRLNDRKINARMGIDGFRQVRPIAKKTRTRVRIQNRSGMPFLLHRYRKRRFALGGVVVFFAILWYLSTHITGIDIVGTERLAKGEVEKGLKEFGLYRGAAVESVDRRLVQNKMMTAFDDIAWIGVNIRGSRAYIEVRERLDTEIAVDTDIPCNIVASRDGIIRGLEVRAGQTVVVLGEMVEKGDLLVSGAMDSKVVGIRYAHSDGEVFAETIYKKTSEYPLEFTEKVFTGKEAVRYTIEGFGARLRLFLNDRPPFEYRDKETETVQFDLFKKKLPPFVRTKTIYREYIPQKRTRTEEEAGNLGKEELCRMLEKELEGKAQILTRQVTYKKKNDKTIEVTAEFVCKEDIAQKSAIDKTENIDYN